MRDKGKNGAAWDPEYFMMILSRMRKSDAWKNFNGKPPGKFDWDINLQTGQNIAN